MNIATITPGNTTRKASSTLIVAWGAFNAVGGAENSSGMWRQIARTECRRDSAADRRFAASALNEPPGWRSVEHASCGHGGAHAFSYFACRRPYGSIDAV